MERPLDWVFYKTEMKIWAVGCGLGWTVLKKVWADYEQLLREVFSTFYEQKKRKLFYENAVASVLKSCIEKSRISFFFVKIFLFQKKPGF